MRIAEGEQYGWDFDWHCVDGEGQLEDFFRLFATVPNAAPRANPIPAQRAMLCSTAPMVSPRSTPTVTPMRMLFFTMSTLQG